MIPLPEQTVAGRARVSSDWLALREPADAAARSRELVALLRPRLGDPAGLEIHDLGCGTGSMARWLAPQLPGPQHWVLHDRDDELLDEAVDRLAGVMVSTRPGDLTALSAADFASASLVTTSALLDLLTLDEVEALADAIAGRPALLTLSVAGQVEFTPADPLDAAFAAAFNDHQRRTVDGRRLLGPDAAAAVIAALRRHAATIEVRDSPWRLSAEHPELTTQWLLGWLSAACEQRPELTAAAGGYARWRQDELAAHRLEIVLHHDDVLACYG
jgi:trans-aconitate methyltransferase